MTIRGSVLAASMAAMLCPAFAHAADLGHPRGGSIKDGYVMQEPTRSVSWYVRGDYARSWQEMTRLEEPPAYELSQTSIAATSSGGFGLGYYFSKNIRGDLTFDWRREAAVSGVLDDGVATVQGTRNFGVKNFLMLANLYYDFDSGNRFSPYIGAGLGFARNTTTYGTVTISGCDTGPTGAPNCAADFDGATQTHVAAALMAGFSLKVHDRVKLDAGYRFLYLGDAHTGDIRITRAVPVPGAPDSTEDPIIRDMTAHELRVGLRVDLR